MGRKRTSVTGLGIISFAALLSGLFFSKAAVAVDNLDFKLLFEKQKCQLSEPIEVRFQLKNKGKKPLYVNKRFKVGLPSTARDQREVFLEGKSPSGVLLQPKFPEYGTGLPRTEDFELVDVGKEVISERKWDLKDYFDFKEPGTYSITATYENVFGKEIGIDTVKEKYTTQATLEIVGEK